MSDTVRVVFAVAVASDGQWDFCGVEGTGHRSDRQQASREAMSNLSYHTGTDASEQRVHFVEADVPIPVKPEPQTIEGEVVESEPEGGR